LRSEERSSTNLTYAISIGFGSFSSIVADGDPETTLYALYESDGARLNDNEYNRRQWGKYGYVDYYTESDAINNYMHGEMSGHDGNEGRGI